MFAAGIAVIFAAYRFRIMGGVLAFWLAYILTRPLGASMGDSLTQPNDEGDLALGTIPVSVVFLLVIVALVFPDESGKKRNSEYLMQGLSENRIVARNSLRGPLINKVLIPPVASRVKGQTAGEATLRGSFCYVTPNTSPRGYTERTCRSGCLSRPTRAARSDRLDWHFPEICDCSRAADARGFRAEPRRHRELAPRLP